MNVNSLYYIIETYLNGNKSHARGYVNKIRYTKPEIINACNLFGMKPALETLTQLGVDRLYLVNAFHDYQRENIEEAKTIINNYKLKN